MRKFYTQLSFVFCLLFSSGLFAQDAFITTWQLTSFGSQGLLITIPTTGTGYNYTVDFGDGTVLTNQTGNVSHTYATTGIKTVSITGDFPRIRFANFTSGSMPSKIKTIEQWGDIQWQSMQGAFRGCTNLRINATDTPNLSQVTSMNEMFREAVHLNDPINNWDVSNVTDMAGMFFGVNDFNQPLDNWDVSNVTDLSGMFNAADSFNQPLNNWNVSNVIYMNGMFSNGIYNQPLDEWDVSNVQNMAGMFSGLYNFNQNLSTWNVSNVTNMASMFYQTYTFDQPLENWDVSNVTDMTNMFGLALAFNQPLNGWDVSSVTVMNGMFSGANSSLDVVAFNQPLNDWNVSNVVHMSNMFSRSPFNQPLNNWDVSTVQYMDQMFWDTPFNQDLSSWEISTGHLENMLSYGTMDIANYDAFLSNLAVRGITNGDLGAMEIGYCNESVRNYLINNLDWTITGDALSDDCNVISGELFFDENVDGCTATETIAGSVMVKANDGTRDFVTFSNNGSYSIQVHGSEFNLSVVNLPSYYLPSPSSAAITFGPTDDEMEMDFCIVPAQNINDLSIVILPLTEARPGFESEYQMVISNVGTATVNSISTTLNFDQNMQSFVSASPVPSSTTPNSLSFAIANVQPLETVTVNFTMQTFTPPTVNGDDVLDFTAAVMPNTDDVTLQDNTYNLSQIVVNSYDPNDKQVLEGAQVHIDDIGNYLNYIIRFQNTGTASAINVNIEDVLHPELDWSTFQPVSASDAYHVQIADGNKVKFIFNGINLPAEIVNEPASHGFVAYKIKPRSDVEVGTVISGNAAIYFDYNAPIITNIASTEIVEALGVDSIVNATDFVIYPNPVQNEMKASYSEGLIIEKIVIYDLTGKVILDVIDNFRKVNVETLASGIYIIKIDTDKGQLTRKLLKN